MLGTVTEIGIRQHRYRDARTHRDVQTFFAELTGSLARTEYVGPNVLRCDLSRKAYDARTHAESRDAIDRALVALGYDGATLTRTGDLVQFRCRVGAGTGDDIPRDAQGEAFASASTIHARQTTHAQRAIAQTAHDILEATKHGLSSRVPSDQRIFYAHALILENPLTQGAHEAVRDGLHAMGYAHVEVLRRGGRTAFRFSTDALPPLSLRERACLPLYARV